VSNVHLAYTSTLPPTGDIHFLPNLCTATVREIQRGDIATIDRGPDDDTITERSTTTSGPVGRVSPLGSLATSAD
jgi:hypothetical protein